MNRIVFESAGSLGGPHSPSAQLHIVVEDLGIGTLSPPMSGCCGASFLSEPLTYEDSMAFTPPHVPPKRGKQMCVSCGNLSWIDETITCPGCQSQVFEDVL